MLPRILPRILLFPSKASLLTLQSVEHFSLEPKPCSPLVDLSQNREINSNL